MVDGGSRFVLTKVHLQEGFDPNLISLPQLLEKGCMIEKTSYQEIVIKHDGIDPDYPIQMVFKRDPNDDLYY